MFHNSPIHDAVFLLQVFCTLAMTGIIWFVQIVHYPLFTGVEDGFTEYERRHARQTTWVVAPLMVVELATAVTLWLSPPSFIRTKEAIFGLLLVLVIWASTFFLQVPIHERLSRSFDAEAHRMLVATNWFRTISWTVRAVIVCAWTHRLLHRALY